MKAPAVSRWRFRYSLRALFLLMTLVCLWLGRQVQIVKARSEFLETNHHFHGYYPAMLFRHDKQMELTREGRPRLHPFSKSETCSIPWHRRLLGDRAQLELFVKPSQVKQGELLFPEAEVYPTRELIPDEVWQAYFRTGFGR